MTMTLPAGSLDEAHDFYSEASLPFPPLPAGVEASVARQGETIWGTRPADPPVYAIEPWVDEAVRGQNFVLFGTDGHGFNSWATHLYTAQGPIAILTQVAAGGPLMDPADAAKRVEKAWGLATGLFDLAAEAGRRGKLPSGQRLIVVDTDLGESRWAWVDPTSSSEPAWQTSPLPPALAATADLARRMAGSP